MCLLIVVTNTLFYLFDLLSLKNAFIRWNLYYAYLRLCGESESGYGCDVCCGSRLRQNTFSTAKHVGSLPDYVWTEILNTPSIIMSYANFDQHNIHSMRT